MRQAGRIIICIVISVFLVVSAVLVLLSLLQQSESTSESEQANTTYHPEDETFWDLTFTVQIESGNAQPINYWGNGVDEYYYFFLPSGCGTDALSVETKHGITLRKQDEEEWAAFQSGELFSGIECGVPYMLGCFDINNYHYETPVMFYEGANIPSIFITTDVGSMDAVLADKDHKEPGHISISDADGKLAYDGRLTHIKGRGNGSWWGAKRPFNIKLGEAADLLDMGSARRWSLISMESDQSLLRNTLSYDLADAVGMPFSPDSELVDLWIDGNYYGVYMLTDRIDISEGNVNITNLEEATEAVNLDDLSTYPQIEGDSRNLLRRYTDIPNDPEDITGGYLLEVDKYYYTDKDAVFSTDDIYYVTLKSPEYASKAQLDYIEDYVRQVEKAILDTDSDDYMNYIDVDSWVKMFLLQEIFANSDFMGSSQYFYKDIDPEGGIAPLYAGPVWDMDVSLGNDEFSSGIGDNVLLINSRTWARELYQNESFYNRMVESYKNDFRPEIDKILNQTLDAYAQKLADSAAMNFLRWAEDPKQDERAVLPEGIEHIRSYLTSRIAILDNLWLNNGDYAIAHITVDKNKHAQDEYFYYDHLIERGEPLGEMDPVEYTGYLFDGWYYGTSTQPGKPYDPEAPITEDEVYIHARYLPLNEMRAEELTERGYALQSCEDLNIYLRLLDDPKYTIYMGMSGHGGVLQNKTVEAMKMLGVEHDFKNTKDSFYAVISNGVLVKEETAQYALTYSGTLPGPTGLTLSSDCTEGGTGAMLMYNGENLFVNNLGLNIVVIDTASGTVVDSVCFNLHYDAAASRK